CARSRSAYGSSHWYFDVW
nr:immunoglobulin heavy chain junction region [Mus musculus]